MDHVVGKLQAVHEADGRIPGALEGEGDNEVAKNKATGQVVVKINPKFYRPAEVELLIGNPEKAERILGWKREINFSNLVDRMVKNDIALLEKR